MQCSPLVKRRADSTRSAAWNVLYQPPDGRPPASLSQKCNEDRTRFTSTERSPKHPFGKPQGNLKERVIGVFPL
nr:hypothetical protein [Streptomyces sp.]